MVAKSQYVMFSNSTIIKETSLATHTLQIFDFSCSAHKYFNSFHPSYYQYAKCFSILSKAANSNQNICLVLDLNNDMIEL